MSSTIGKGALPEQDLAALKSDLTFRGDRRSWTDRRRQDAAFPGSKAWAGIERRLADRRATQTVALLWQQRKSTSAV
ncbi:MAG: hypothetical protein ACR2PZ_09735 [Pseudomonadales bacterium]